MKKTAKIVVDTSIVIKAFAASPINNPHRDFLELFVKENISGDTVLYLCIDLPPSSIYQEYEQAIQKVSRPGAVTEFERWYRSLREGYKAISAEDGSIDDLRWHRRELENSGCKKEVELVFVARAFYNKLANEKGILVAESCDIREYQKNFFKEEIGQHLNQHMQVEIVDIEGAVKWIQSIWTQEVPQDPYSSKKRVRNLIAKCFTLDEFEELCYELEIPMDNFPGEHREDKAHELVDYYERYGRVQDLISQLKKKRPHFSWPDPWPPW